MKKLPLFIAPIILVVACTSLDPVSVSSNDLNMQSELRSNKSPDQLTTSVKQVIAELNWKILYEGSMLPKGSLSGASNTSPLHSGDFDAVAWNKTLKSGAEPYKFVEVITPVTFFSYGAAIFIVVFKAQNGETSVAITGSTSQVNEKKKMEIYIKEFSDRLNLK